MHHLLVDCRASALRLRKLASIICGLAYRKTANLLQRAPTAFTWEIAPERKLAVFTKEEKQLVRDNVWHCTQFRPVKYRSFPNRGASIACFYENMVIRGSSGPVVLRCRSGYIHGVVYHCSIEQSCILLAYLPSEVGHSGNGVIVFCQSSRWQF